MSSCDATGYASQAQSSKWRGNTGRATVRVAALFLICLTNLIAAQAALPAPALFADESIVLPLEVRTPSSVPASRGRSYPTC